MHLLRKIVRIPVLVAQPKTLNDLFQWKLFGLTACTTTQRSSVIVPWWKMSGSTWRKSCCSLEKKSKCSPVRDSSFTGNNIAKATARQCPPTWWVVHGKLGTPGRLQRKPRCVPSCITPSNQLANCLGMYIILRYSRRLLANEKPELCDNKQGLAQICRYYLGLTSFAAGWVYWVPQCRREVAVQLRCIRLIFATDRLRRLSSRFYT